ncbi:hypothetical protein T261_6822 [Streptomyces lydicus]|nr:hypothetical protein T261_6822 [Streptomyces lydicus]
MGCSCRTPAPLSSATLDMVAGLIRGHLEEDPFALAQAEPRQAG